MFLYLVKGASPILWTVCSWDDLAPRVRVRWSLEGAVTVMVLWVMCLEK